MQDDVAHRAAAALAFLHEKWFDCATGAGGCALGVWLGQHWLTLGGSILLTWRMIQAFVLEPMGIFWPRPRARRRRWGRG